MKDSRWKAILQGAFGHVRRWTRRPRGLGAAPGPAQPRLALAFGGGFARGLAHIGVLKVLEENRVGIHHLVGTSVGSLIAGSYASGVPLTEIRAVAGRVEWKDFGQWTLSRMGLATMASGIFRSEEHTPELQSQFHIVC